MRGNCNIICAAVPTSLKDFDSCMRKDCDAFISLLSPSTSDFDSCMREDCNKAHEGLSLDLPILIHACARVATDSSSSRSVPDLFQFMHARGLQHRVEAPGSISIHACARIATPQETERRTLSFDLCMREDCNAARWSTS